MITFNKIGTFGRLGNQMFQYATLFAIAKTRKYEFGVPYNNRNANEYADFCLPDAFGNLSAKDSNGAFIQRSAKENIFEYNAGIFGIPDHTDISGYFQSEKYFVAFKNQLLKEFTFKEHILQKAKDIRSVTKQPVISVHIRLGDYQYLQDSHPICTIDYYREALRQLPDDMLLYIFSDEPYKASMIFKNLNRPYTIMENGCKYIDMATMSLCDYHIIANSSFSWWGAWLASSKKIIAPSKWFGDSPSAPKNWSDIYCKDWIIL